MFTTFYHSITKTITASFGTLFNGIYVERGSGSTYKKIKVPLTYAPKERLMERINLELDDPKAYAVQLTLPRMSFMLTGMEYDTERKRNSSSRRSVFPIESNGISVNYHYSEVPYKLSFSLFVYARTMDDGLQIIEQILPFFTPEFTITIKPGVLKDVEEKIDIPITLTEITPDQQFEGSFKDENTRIIIWELKFSVRTLYYGPVKDGKPIKEMDINFFNLD